MNRVKLLVGLSPASSQGMHKCIEPAYCRFIRPDTEIPVMIDPKTKTGCPST